MKTLRCYDLCCGAGALSHGFVRAGASILGGVDIDPRVVRTAAFNHPTGRWEVMAVEELAKKILNDRDHPVWRANTLLAGLPCQGFSQAGRRNPEDPRNGLYKPMLRIVSEVKPDHVVIENVQGLMAPRNAGTFQSIINGLKRNGYNVTARLLNAVDFGVPQYRKRVFIVALAEGRPEWVFECLRSQQRVRTVRDAFKGLPSNKEDKAKSHVIMMHGPKVIAMLKKLKPRGPISYRRLQWDLPSPTVIAGHRALPVHPDQPRAITVREAARLQGFSDSFRFQGSRSSQIEQVANAVPPPLATAVAEGLVAAKARGERVTGFLYRSLAAFGGISLSKRLETTFLTTARNGLRDYPWRRRRHPFSLLVTEILLQRTNADLVASIWDDAMTLVPNAEDAARVDLRRLKSLVRRIGLFSKANTLKDLALAICQKHNGRVPRDYEELLRLPGVGIYIASAVRALAFNVPDFPVDSNAFRFVERYFGIATARKKSEARQIREFMISLLPKRNLRDYLYGFLDWAALVCRPSQPLCNRCFLRLTCQHVSRLKD